MSEDPEELIPYDLTGNPQYYVEWPAGLPHDPLWNLIPRRRGAGSWECGWHGIVAAERCEGCHAEHLETGMFQARFNSHEDARAAADAGLDAYAAGLPKRADEITGWLNESLEAILPDGLRFEWVEDA